MRAENPWITYRTRFLVKAKQLTGNLSFTDALGREHSGRKGDYLVEFSDGVLRIASRQIFEDIYVPVMADHYPPGANSEISDGALLLGQHETLSARESSRPGNRSGAADSSSVHTASALSVPVHLARKAQPSYREGHFPCSV